MLLARVDRCGGFHNFQKGLKELPRLEGPEEMEPDDRQQLSIIPETSETDRAKKYPGGG